MYVVIVTMFIRCEDHFFTLLAPKELIQELPVINFHRYSLVFLKSFVPALQNNSKLKTLRCEICLQN